MVRVESLWKNFKQLLEEDRNGSTPIQHAYLDSQSGLPALEVQRNWTRKKQNSSWIMNTRF